MALSPLVASQLFGVGAADPVTIAGVAARVLTVALLAAAIPAAPGPARRSGHDASV